MSCYVLIQLFQCTVHHSMVKTALYFLPCEYSRLITDNVFCCRFFAKS